MSALIQTGFDYAALPVDAALNARAAAERIKLRLKRTVEDIIEIGWELKAIKPMLEGVFGKWFEDETGLAREMADKFMGVSEKFGNGMLNNLAQPLSPTVLYLLSAPSTPDTVIDRAIEKAESGEKVTVADVKDWKAEESRWKETVAYHQKLAESTQNELALERQRSAEWKAQWKAERDKPAVEKVPADYDLLKQTERDLRNELADLKQQQRGLVQQQVVAKLKERESELADIDQKVHDAESRLDGLRAQIDRYSMQERELKVHMEVIEKARTAMAVLAANMEGFDAVIDTDHELRRWRALADMMEQGAVAIRHFVGDAKPHLTVIPGGAA